MAQGGKFSNPRPHRDEERQIEQAFRQVTGQESAPKAAAWEEDRQMVFPQSAAAPTPLDEEAQIEQAFQQVTGQQPAPKKPNPAPAAPKTKKFDLLPDDMDAFFDDEAPEFPEDSEDFEDSQSDFVSKLLAFCEKNQKAVMVGLCAAALLLIVGFIAIFFARPADPNDGKILDNVIIADINVGGMTKNEAISAVKQATSHTYGSQDMVIDLSGTELRLSPRETGAKLDVKAAVNAAYDYGRTGTKSEQEQALTLSRTEPYIIGVLPYLELDTLYIKETLAAYAKDSGSTLTQPTYGLEGEEPELSADKFDENAPTQTLVITMGTPGIGFDVNDVYDQILDAYSLHVFSVEVENVESVKDPEPVDLEAIYKEYYIEPVDASVNLQTFQTVPGSYGYGFDLKAAQKLIENAQFGEVVRIPMEYITPDILDADSFYQDVLGEHQTRHTGNDNRTTNLRLACQAINGTVVNPGETFSFNGTVGQRTSAKGYVSAPADASPNGETTLGGGITQVSSTLYYAALLADLDIVSRTANKFAPDFIDYGMDAAVSWNHYDFSFRNNLGYPIQISAEVSGGYVKIRILGTDERSHYVMLDYTISKTTDPKTEYQEFAHDNPEGYKDRDVVQEGVTGYSIKSYKVKYDKETNKKLSRDFVANTEYLSLNRILAKVEKPVETTAPTVAPTVPETEPVVTTPPTVPTEPTVPSTEATEATNPPETTQPPQTEAPAATEVSTVTEATESSVVSEVVPLESQTA